MNSQKINIGVTGTGSLIGQAIIKCINISSLKNNIEITGFDYVNGSVGSYWCKNHYLLPDIFKKNIKEEVWLNAILEHIKQHQLKILFIGIDFELPVFARLKSFIEKETGCFVVVSGEEVIKIADDKYLTANFLKENNLFYPKSFTKLEYKTGMIEFPLIVKPRIGFRSRGVSIVNSQIEFDNVINSINEPVIQECVGSMETEYTCGIIYFDNEVKASIALSRTLKEGNTFTADYNTKSPKIIYDYLEKVTKAIKPYGVLNFQLRIDENGEPKIFEINARHSGTTFMRALFGYNEVEYIICYLLKMSVPSMVNLKPGRAIRFYDEFFIETK